jgi:predicted nuclease with TOPRIM domain
MDDQDPHRALSVLLDLHEALQDEVNGLSTTRQELQAKLEALEGELKGVDTELKAKRRMLKLVLDTAQELSNQHVGWDENWEPYDLPEVRGGC